MKFSRVFNFLAIFIVVALLPNLFVSAEEMADVQPFDYPLAHVQKTDDLLGISSIVDATVSITITDYDPNQTQMGLHAHFDYSNSEGLLRDFDATSKDNVTNFTFNKEGAGNCWYTSDASLQCDENITRLIVSYDYTQDITGDLFSVGAGINVPNGEIHGYVTLGYPSKIHYEFASLPPQPLPDGSENYHGLLEWEGVNDNSFGAYVTFNRLKPWTILYYLAEDDDVSSSISTRTQGFLEASNNDNVNIVFFRDIPFLPVLDSPVPNVNQLPYYFSFEYAYGSLAPKKVELPYEVNTGDAKTLEEFVGWGQSNYPANHYAVVFFGHAHGAIGIGIDNDPGIHTDDEKDCIGSSGIAKHCLSFLEIRQTLELPSLEDIEVIYLAGCTTATVEAAYELRTVTDYIVASQNLAFMEVISHKGYVIENPIIDFNTTALDLAVGMAEDYKDTVINQYNEKWWLRPIWLLFADAPITISVLDTSHIDALATEIYGFANWMLAQNYFSQLDDISANVQRFGEDRGLVIDEGDSFVDLYHFAQLAAETFDDPMVQSSATAIMQTIESPNLVVYDFHQTGNHLPSGNLWELDNSHGISIYFPNACVSFYGEKWLTFAGGSDWQCAATQNWYELNERQAAPANWGGFVSEYVIITNTSLNK